MSRRSCRASAGFALFVRAGFLGLVCLRFGRALLGLPGVLARFFVCLRGLVGPRLGFFVALHLFLCFGLFACLLGFLGLFFFVFFLALFCFLLLLAFFLFFALLLVALFSFFAAGFARRGVRRPRGGGAGGGRLLCLVIFRRAVPLAHGKKARY